MSIIRAKPYPFKGWPVYAQRAAETLGYPREAAIMIRHSRLMEFMSNMAAQACEAANPLRARALLMEALKWRDVMAIELGAADSILADLWEGILFEEPPLKTRQQLMPPPPATTPNATPGEGYSPAAQETPALVTTEESTNHVVHQPDDSSERGDVRSAPGRGRKRPS